MENGLGDGDVCRGKGGVHRIAVERGVDGVRRAGRHPRRLVQQRAESRSRWKPASRCRRRCSSRPARRSRWTRAPANTWNAPDVELRVQDLNGSFQSPPRAGFFILRRKLLFKASGFGYFCADTYAGASKRREECFAASPFPPAFAAAKFSSSTAPATSSPGADWPTTKLQ